MLFNSYVFLFLFFPITLIGFYILKALKLSVPMKVWLIGMSLWFYGYFNPWYLIIIVTSIVVNYLLCILMNKVAATPELKGRRKAIMVVGIVFNVGILFYYKYFNFFIDNVNWIFKTDFCVEKILLPLGISFFTFQEIGFMVDAYRGDVKNLSFVDFMLFVTFFPQLIAGPIVTQDEMLPQFNNLVNKKFSKDQFARGLALFIMGLMKKVLIADVFGKAVDWAYAYHSSLNGTGSLLALLFANLQMYFDFSGYCDMARGIGGMFLIDIVVNFNSPYKAKSVIEFWSRWQITMSRFLTKYIYIPLGGSRKGNFRTYLNTFIVFTISGIWHGAGWKYMIWGMLFGVLNIFSRMLRGIKKKIPPLINNIEAFIFIALQGALFRADTLKQFWEMLTNVFTKGFGAIPLEMAEAFNRTEYVFLQDCFHISALSFAPYIMIVLFMILAFFLCFVTKNACEIAASLKFKPITGVILSIGFVWAVVSLSEVSTFLYFNF